MTERSSAGEPRHDVSPPGRGIYDTTAAEEWTDGFLTGNGETGAVLYGTPSCEKVLLNHHRFVLPNGTRDILPPDIAGRLRAVQDLALAGQYSRAAAMFAAGWQLQWTQTFHPGYELWLAAPDMAGGENYVRSIDFRTGEVTSSWIAHGGGWSRRAFVSRSDRVVVHELVPAAGQTLAMELYVNTALDDVPDGVAFTTAAEASGDAAILSMHATYPPGQGAYGYAGVTRVVVAGTGASVTAHGATVRITGATTVLLVTGLARYETAGDVQTGRLRSILAVVPADYEILLERHRRLHGAMFDRSALDLGVPAADRGLPISELIARQNADPDTVDPALLERLYDSGRYLLLSSSGVLPPRLAGVWTRTWSGAWAGDFTTDANVNLQVAAGTITGLGEAMRGYFDLVLGQLGHWRTNAARIYGARGFLAPSRTDGEYGHMLHFNADTFPGQCWTGGADWLLYPLLEHYLVTGDPGVLAELGPVLMELALFYEDFLTRTGDDGKVVFVPSFSMENAPANIGSCLSINATGDITAGRHALQAAIDAADALHVEQGAGQGVERWTELLDRLPGYAIDSNGALAEWVWPGLTGNDDHRHVQHLYGAWPLHEINPEETPELVEPALQALRLRGDQNLSAHGSLHRALVHARLKDGAGVYANLRKILGNNMVFRSMMTAHNPNLEIYNADAAHALPAVLAEMLIYSRPGVLEILPALPDELPTGTITGIRGRNRVQVESLSWDTAAGSAAVTLCSDVDQVLTLICRRGISWISTTVPVAESPLGDHARRLSQAAGQSVRVTLGMATIPTAG